MNFKQQASLTRVSDRLICDCRLNFDTSLEYNGLSWVHALEKTRKNINTITIHRARLGL